MRKHFRLILLLIVVLYTNRAFSQTPIALDSLNSKPYSNSRVKLLAATGVTIYVGSMTGLYLMWYKDYPQSSFHFFDDNREWLQMDKVGHATTSYYLSQVGFSACRWAGLSSKKATWWGGATGFTYLTIIEILDGFSSEWGFSTGDLIANTSGSLLFTGQQLLWDEQRIMMKYSHHSTMESSLRPDLLGSNASERWLKNYNGSTFWLSANVSSFLSKTSKFPKWLNIAVGYGASGMLGGNSNPNTYNGNSLPTLERRRQWYLSLDIDLRKINTRFKTLNNVIHMFNFIKIPMPTIEFIQGDKTKFYWMYF
jgi:hypothetical protein